MCAHPFRLLPALSKTRNRKKLLNCASVCESNFHPIEMELEKARWSMEAIKFEIGNAGHRALTFRLRPTCISLELRPRQRRRASGQRHACNQLIFTIAHKTELLLSLPLSLSLSFFESQPPSRDCLRLLASSAAAAAAGNVVRQ